MNIVLIGAPLSGKGTQSEYIKNKFNLHHISMGDLFREIVTKQSPLAEKVKFYLNKAILVPDEITIEVLKEKLSSLNSSNGVLLDGFPRTLNQAQILDSTLKIDKVIFINVQLNSILKRVSGRFICSNCKKIHTIYDDSIKNCTECGRNLIKRIDDTEETVKKRYDEFALLTYPIVDYYKNQNKVFEVDGSKTVYEVSEEIENCLKSI